MKHEIKIKLYIVIYCALMWLTNWSISHDYDRTEGSIHDSMDYRVIGSIIGLIATYILARKAWRLIRYVMAFHIRIPLGQQLWGSWGILLLLLPICFSHERVSSGIADDGASVRTVFSYGGESSLVLIIFSASAVMLFQLVVYLESFTGKEI